MELNSRVLSNFRIGIELLLFDEKTMLLYSEHPARAVLFRYKSRTIWKSLFGGK